MSLKIWTWKDVSEQWLKDSIEKESNSQWSKADHLMSKHGGGSVMIWTYGYQWNVLQFTDDVTADRKRKLNSEVYVGQYALQAFNHIYKTERTVFRSAKNTANSIPF